ncbi:MAG: hypothetical protein ACLGIG_01975 [Actinomycetes bacterium]
MRLRGRDLPPGVPLVVGLQVVGVALTVGWFATGNSGAPDGGLQQIDMLTLHERVPGVDAVDGRPTMLVVTNDACPEPAVRRLDDRYGLVVTTDADIARRLALPAAAERCQPGYVLLDGDGVVRYRTYDPGWARHDEEQEILLENIAEDSEAGPR